MANLGTRAVWILLAVLALTAAIGFEQGLARSLSAARADAPAAPADPDREPVPRAQPLAPPVLAEADVRRIAREEAEAALARARPRKVASAEPSTEENETAAGGASRPAALAAKPAPAAAPKPAATPAAAAPAPPAGGQIPF